MEAYQTCCGFFLFEPYKPYMWKGNAAKAAQTGFRAFLERGSNVFDIMLDADGDLAVSESGDISLTQSVRQAILIRLRWFLTEWRLGPGIGLDYWGTILVKNPNIVKIRQAIRDEILTVEEVKAVNDVRIAYNAQTRQTVVTYEAVTNEETFREEVKINA